MPTPRRGLVLIKEINNTLQRPKAQHRRLQARAEIDTNCFVPLCAAGVEALHDWIPQHTGSFLVVIIVGVLQHNKPFLPEGGKEHLALRDRLVHKWNGSLRGLVEANHIIGNTHVHFMNVSTFPRDPPATPGHQLTFQGYDGGSCRGPGIHLFWDNWNTRLNIKREHPSSDLHLQFVLQYIDGCGHYQTLYDRIANIFEIFFGYFIGNSFATQSQ